MVELGYEPFGEGSMSVRNNESTNLNSVYFAQNLRTELAS